MIESQFHKLSSEQTPFFYTRYVDDIFVLFNNESSALKFYNFMNSIDKNLQFIYEMPNDSHLPFLDTCISIKNNSFTIKHYQKPTHTGLFIPSFSFCPNRYKGNTLFMLFQRSFKINRNFSDINSNQMAIVTQLLTILLVKSILSTNR